MMLPAEFVGDVIFFSILTNKVVEREVSKKLILPNIGFSPCLFLPSFLYLHELFVGNGNLVNVKSRT